MIKEIFGSISALFKDLVVSFGYFNGVFTN